jgi:hypothetical protein
MIKFNSQVLIAQFFGIIGVISFLLSYDSAKVESQTRILIIITVIATMIVILLLGVFINNRGYKSGVNEGIRQGLEEGEQKGYLEGYEKGLAKGKEQTSWKDNVGYRGDYDGVDDITNFMTTYPVEEMWLSGGALFYCIEKLKNSKCFKKGNGNTIKLKFIVTDNDSNIALELYANRSESGDEDKGKIHKNLFLAYERIKDLIKKLRKSGFNIEYEIYLNPYPMSERIWIVNPKKTHGMTFIKTYPDKNHNHEGIYNGGFKFKLTNDISFKNGFYFFLEKFEIYKSLSGNPIATHRDRNEFERLLNYSSTLNPVFNHLSPQKVDNERINKILEVFPNEIQSSLTDDKLNEQTEP